MVITSVGKLSGNIQENHIDVQDSINQLPNLTGFYPEADSMSVCSKTGFSGITFYDTNNVLGQIDLSHADRFPFLFTEKNLRREQESRAVLVKSLKEGKEIPADLFHSDWIILVIIIAAICYSVIRVLAKNLFTEATRFFFSRGANDPGSHDTSSLFHWQSTLMNFVSFLNTGLFSYLVLTRYNMLPENLQGIQALMISFIVISLLITLRHFICLITGNISDEPEAFNEYIHVVYQWYRIIGLISFILVILISYTSVFPPGLLFISGFVLFAVAYFFRVFRLFLIFLKRDISIFYLILYLCALEFLPVLISIKYFTGLA
jgi:hypothetical protein